MESQNNKKKRIAVIFGGRSSEHEVSLQSAKNIVEAIDKIQYDITLIKIDKQGYWKINQPQKVLSNNSDITLESFESPELIPNNQYAIDLSTNTEVGHIDVVFPVLHGTYGEDGTIQGLLKLSNIPFVGCDVLSSAVCMDKEISKKLLREAKIPVGKFKVIRKEDISSVKYIELVKELNLPFFLKPANSGSSVGIHKVHNEDEFAEALNDAFQYDKKILVEEYINGREIECSVLGNTNPTASIPGEIVPHHDFYSYEAKYLDENGASLIIPAEVPEDIKHKIQDLAVKTFKTLNCEGMARVDFFLRDSELYVNEINTIPGFTKISMYPKLWEASGISYSELINKLITLAIERHQSQNEIKTTYQITVT